MMTFKEAHALLRAKGWIKDNGDLEYINRYLLWKVGSTYICLDGDFNAKELEVISAYVNGYSHNQPDTE